MYDTIIRNGIIIDGTGGPAYHADVAIRDGKIVKIGRGLTGAAETIDATGLCVTPGFIDSHAHADGSIIPFPEQREKVEQGITTCISGQCGSSVAPLSKLADPARFKDRGGIIGSEYKLRQSYDGFIEVARELPQGCNVVVLLGHGNLRASVMGRDNREPTAEEMEEMKRRVRAAMEHGALGMSFGLYYPPGCYAKTEEAIELARIVGEYHGLIAAHIRNEAEELVKAVKEFILIAKEAGVRAVISHHKSHGKPENWGKVSHTLRLIDEANKNGQDVYCDVYPYIASATAVSAVFLPKEEHAKPAAEILEDLNRPAFRAALRARIIEEYGTDLSWVLPTTANPYRDCLGKTVPEIATLKGKDPFDVLFDLMLESKLGVNAAFFSMCEEDVETVIAHPRAMICTDSGNVGLSKYYHPRLRASFPRALGEYARARGIVSLPEMIRKMTSMPARVYDLPAKGLIWENMDADICIFDENTIKDRAMFSDVAARAEGLRYVLVNGKTVVRDAVSNGEKHGKVITYRG